MTPDVLTPTTSGKSDVVRRARGCLMGLAIGDALGGPTEGKSQEEIARRWGRVDGFLTDDQSGSDDTEYALFNARLLIRHGTELRAAMVAEAWNKEIVNSSNAHKGAGFSEMMAIRNLKAGLLPPESGQHLHSWSDGLAMRVAPFGIVAAGDPTRAAKLAAEDGSVTHSGEGVFAGQAVAAAVAVAMLGSNVDAIVDAARKVIPADSWTSRGIERAVTIANKYPDVWSALKPLSAEIVVSSYFWPDIGPEAVALAFGVIAASRGNFRDAVLGGVNMGRDTDTIAAIAGAIIGARQGIDALPPEWTRRVSVARGTCLESIKGMDVLRTADAIADLANARDAKP
jgi:ADP-ribosylglycohydrolase